MHNLFVTFQDDGKGVLRAVRALRKATTYLNKPLSISEARKVLDEVGVNGYALAGQTESALAMERAVYEINTNSDGTLFPYVDDEIAAAEATAEVMEDEALDVEIPADRLPTPEGFDVAMVLLGTAGGKAVDVMQACISLKYSTKDPVYDEALRALTRAYPFVGELLKANGMWPA